MRMMLIDRINQVYITITKLVGSLRPREQSNEHARIRVLSDRLHFTTHYHYVLSHWRGISLSGKCFGYKQFNR